MNQCCEPKSAVTLLLVACLVFPLSVGPQSLLFAQDSSIHVEVNLVTLRFTVRDNQGRFLNGLNKEDFLVIENQKVAEIRHFEPPRVRQASNEPLWLAFLLDVSGSTFSTRVEEILAARSFLENVYDFTKVGIFGFTDKIFPFQDFTSDRSVALEAFGAARTHLGRTAIYDSVDSLVSQLGQQAGSSDRKVAIVVSDGMDEKYHRYQDSVRKAIENGVTLYTVWVPSAAQLYIKSASEGQVSGEDKDSRKAKEGAFGKLSEGTGGRHFGGFETILDFDNVLAEINDEVFGNLYTISYYTEDAYLDRSERDIAVEVKQDNASIHGLFKKTPDRVQAKKKYIAALFDTDAISELSVGADRFYEIGAELDFLRQRTGESKTSLPFRIKISPYSLTQGSSGEVATQFGVVGLLYDTEGKEVVRLREVFRAHLEKKHVREGRGIIYNNRLFAPQGDYYLKLALLELSTWKMTVLEGPVQIK